MRKFNTKNWIFQFIDISLPLIECFYNHDSKDLLQKEEIKTALRWS